MSAETCRLRFPVSSEQPAYPQDIPIRNIEVHYPHSFWLQEKNLLSSVAGAQRDDAFRVKVDAKSKGTVNSGLNVTENAAMGWTTLRGRA